MRCIPYVTINLVAELTLIEQQDSNNAEQGFVWYHDNDPLCQDS